VRTATPAQRAAVGSAAYQIAWPVVFQRITRPVERRRGHRRCFAAMNQLADECLDGFHDDVEAVVADLLDNARAEILNVEAWLCGRMVAATVDAHRRRRGLRGALQRPRLPKWLSAELSDDPWLTRLAVHILDWVGVPETAGAETWPLDTWAQARAEVTGDWAGSSPRAVLDEVNRILRAMRGRRPNWYAAYVERPLGAKIPPPAPPAGTRTEQRPVRPMTPDDETDVRLTGLASTAVQAIAAGIRRGDDPRETVVQVLRTVFGSGSGSDALDRAPGAGIGLDDRVPALVRDPRVVDRIVVQVMGIIGRD
jgi:hypothetical protein